MNRLGPNELKLADIASEAGVTAGALTQRFGSKRTRMLALAQMASAGTDDFVRQLRLERVSPLATVRAYAECMAGMAQTPEALARSVAYLQLDLADDDFRVHLATQGAATRASLQDLIEAAVSEGELLPNADSAALARVLESLTRRLGDILGDPSPRKRGRVAAARRGEVLRPYLAVAKGARRAPRAPNERSRQRSRRR